MVVCANHSCHEGMCHEGMCRAKRDIDERCASSTFPKAGKDVGSSESNKRCVIGKGSDIVELTACTNGGPELYV